MEAQIPGGPFVNLTDELEKQIPGAQALNDNTPPATQDALMGQAVL
jgi:hypothetical protein